MAALRRHIKENDIYRWVADILHDIGTVSAGKSGTCRSFFDHASEIEQKIGNRKPFLFLDYDGTLAPIAESPDRAHMTDDMRALLGRIKDRMPVAVISGRSLRDLRDRVGIEGIVCAGNHGAEIWDGEKTVLCPGSENSWGALRELLEALRAALGPVPGVLIEDKVLTASVHFRLVDENRMGDFFHLFNLTTKKYETLFRITSGKKVFEIRPLDAWNKGDAVSWILGTMGGGRIPLYVGDDVTDEDAFYAIKERGISVSVGECTGADYSLKGQEEVKPLLGFILDAMERASS
jgi:trehalose-phosphatase